MAGIFENDKGAMNTSKRIKVVWLCHFANDEINGILKPSRKVMEYAPWIPIALKAVEKANDFDVYVVSPYPFIRKTISFDLRGIHYTFYNPYVLFNRLFYNKYFKFDFFTNFVRNKKITKRIVHGINPDVIHLFGAENAYYSSTALQFYSKYPVILTVQGFINKSSSDSIFVKKRKKIERQILKNTQFAFCEAKCLGEDIKKYSPNVKLYWYFYGSYEVQPSSKKNEKKYDIVFFARINRDKGILDLIEAINILKTDRPNIKACIIGGNKENEFSQYARDIGLEKNIEWTGFLDTREEVHQKAQEGLISVLPTYHDINPGTIIESMFLGIPVVSYDIPSNKEINEKGEAIRLVEYKNVSCLASSIADLLDHPEKREELSNKAKERAKEMFAPTNEYLQTCLLDGYEACIAAFKKSSDNKQS